MKYLVKTKDGQTLLTNCSGLLIETHRRETMYAEREIEMILEVEDNSERKSPKIRGHYFDVLENLSADVLKTRQEKFNKYNHIIQTISTQISQKMEGYLGAGNWYSNKYDTSLENIEKIYLVDKDETRKLVHYFNKASIDLKNHIEGWEIIYINDVYLPEFSEVSLKRAILNQFSSFSEEFNESGISLKFSEHFSEKFTVHVDKKLFSLVMYNFFSNALKYSMPDMEIRFNYDDDAKNLDVSMYSVKLERGELNEIFEDGVRGLNANDVSSSGYGLGLFALKKSLKLMGLNNMYISPQYSKTKNYNDITFVENHFQFNFSQNT